MGLNQSIEAKLDNYFNIEKEVSRETLEIITWYIYQLEQNRQHDLYLIAKILSEKDVSSLVSYFSGDTIKVPQKEEYVNLKLTAVCFFLKKMQNWNWKQIKEFLNIPEKDTDVFSSLSLGHKINKISDNLNEDIKNILKNTKFEDEDKIRRIFKDYLGNE